MTDNDAPTTAAWQTKRRPPRDRALWTAEDHAQANRLQNKKRELDEAEALVTTRRANYHSEVKRAGKTYRTGWIAALIEQHRTTVNKILTNDDDSEAKDA